MTTTYKREPDPNESADVYYTLTDVSEANIKRLLESLWIEGVDWIDCQIDDGDGWIAIDLLPDANPQHMITHAETVLHAYFTPEEAQRLL
jgi:hypothetical protein